jgi:hypothetical protein
MVFSLLASASGCRNDDVELVEVTGTVTLDGQPLPEATVRFLPIVTGDEPARPSSALTTDEGEFALGYSTTKQGARPGKYRIYISTFRNPEPGLPGKPETVPLCYNTETTLTEEVTAEQHEFTFNLQSDAGKIVQPRY